MLNQFIKMVEGKHLLVDSVIVTKGEERYEHYFTDEKEGSIRSISKLVSALGAGKAIEKNLYTLDTDVFPYFDEEKITNEKNIPYLKKLKIRHLLSLTLGQDQGLMFRQDIQKFPADTDYVSHILNYDMKYDPGTHFTYTNAATYLLCAITQKITGRYFRDWVEEELFAPVGIELGEWEKSWQGICLGASGLKLTNNNLHKIALLLLGNGSYQGRQVIAKEWIEMMHTPQFFTAELPNYVNKQNRCINKMAYGFGLWICGDGSKEYPKTHYFCDGTDGQFLIVSPEGEMAITILSHDQTLDPIVEAIEYFFK